MGKKNKTYDGDFKIMVVEDILFNKLSFSDALVKYFPHITTVNRIDGRGNKIRNDSKGSNYRFIKKWVELYKTEGKERLKQDLRGKWKEKLPPRPNQIVYPSEDTLVKIQRQLWDIRQDANLSKLELSRRIGMSHDYVAKLERVQANCKQFMPNLKTFLAILMACNVTPVEFFTGLEKED